MKRGAHSADTRRSGEEVGSRCAKRNARRSAIWPLMRDLKLFASLFEVGPLHLAVALVHGAVCLAWGEGLRLISPEGAGPRWLSEIAIRGLKPWWHRICAPGRSKPRRGLSESRRSGCPGRRVKSVSGMGRGRPAKMPWRPGCLACCGLTIDGWSHHHHPGSVCRLLSACAA